jgi:acyl-coenzyme A thioesterase PaaI-like protein
LAFTGGPLKRPSAHLTRYIVDLMSLYLPHTAGCLVCGKDNPHGLHLNFTVDPTTGVVHTHFTPTSDHIGFSGIAHGGILATVFDEAMVWAASWHGKRFCVCGELTVRFRREAAVGVPLKIAAMITSPRLRLIQTKAVAHDPAGNLIAESCAKYIQMPADRHARMVATLVLDPATEITTAALKSTN